MTYEKFMEQVKEQIMSFLPEEYANADVTIQEVSKNNNQKFHAICIKRPEAELFPMFILKIIIGHMRMMEYGKYFDRYCPDIQKKHGKQ